VVGSRKILRSTQDDNAEFHYREEVINRDEFSQIHSARIVL